MRISDFDLYKELLKEKSGLILTPDKSYLLDSRLTPIAKKWGYASLTTMTMALRAVPDPDLVRDVVESMAVTDTAFFRDRLPFSLFNDIVLPQFKKNRKKTRTLRIWSAGCSSGQEAYSIAMALRENMDLLSGWKIEILATDMALAPLEIAREGSYTQFEIQRGLPIRMLLKYFDQHEDGWTIKPEVRNMISFKPFNLLDPMSELGIFDVIFCRNVISAFDEEDQAKVLSRLSERLEPDGFLFLGINEHADMGGELFAKIEQQRGAYILNNGKYTMEELTQAVG